jgi:hypothetical protein
MSIPHWNTVRHELGNAPQGQILGPAMKQRRAIPIAAANRFGDLPRISPDDDLITSKLQALQYSISLRFHLPRLPRAASIRRPQSVEMAGSAVRPGAAPAF